MEGREGNLGSVGPRAELRGFVPGLLGNTEAEESGVRPEGTWASLASKEVQGWPKGRWGPWGYAMPRLKGREIRKTRRWEMGVRVRAEGVWVPGLLRGRGAALGSSPALLGFKRVPGSGGLAAPGEPGPRSQGPLEELGSGKSPGPPGGT